MKKTCLSIIFMTVFALSSQAQGYLTDISGTPLKERAVEDLGLSTFYNNEFLKGTITLSDNSVYADIYLRYNLATNDLVYRKPNSTISMTPNGIVIGFTLERPSGELVRFKSVVTGDKSVDGFYELIHQGKVSLLKKVRKNVVESVEYNSKSTTKNVVATTNYYLLKAPHSLVLIKTDKKSLLKALGNDVALNAYIGSQKLNLKQDADLAKLMSYYDTLSN